MSEAVETTEISEVEKMVLDFMTKTKASTDPSVWIGLVDEEADELEEALVNVFKESCDLIYVVAGYQLSKKAAEDVALPPEHLPKMKRALGLINAMLALLSPKWLNAAFEEVHKSNMTKIGPNGEVEYTDTGKVAKGPFYTPPNLRALVIG